MKKDKQFHIQPVLGSLPVNFHFLHKESIEKTRQRASRYADLPVRNAGKTPCHGPAKPISKMILPVYNEE